MALFCLFIGHSVGISHWISICRIGRSVGLYGRRVVCQWGCLLRRVCIVYRLLRSPWSDPVCHESFVSRTPGIHDFPTWHLWGSVQTVHIDATNATIFGKEKSDLFCQDHCRWGRRFGYYEDTVDAWLDGRRRKWYHRRVAQGANEHLVNNNLLDLVEWKASFVSSPRDAKETLQYWWCPRIETFCDEMGEFETKWELSQVIWARLIRIFPVT